MRSRIKKYPLMPFITALLIAAALFCAACTNPEAPTPMPTPTTPPTTPPPATPPPATPPPATPPPATPPPATPPPVQGPNEVWAVSMEFRPYILTVPAGTTVIWSNKDSDTHTVVSDTGIFRGNLQPLDGTYSFTFSAPGTFTYNCDLHPGMEGSVIVK